MDVTRGHEDDVFAEAQLAHVPRPGASGRTMVVITLTGGDDALREALGDRVIAAARDALTPPSQPGSEGSAAPAEVAAAGAMLAREPAPPAISPYEAPFLLAPLHPAP